MRTSAFNEFRLVGGTALSLQLGHRTSVDIDLFTDSKYGTIDTELIAMFLKQNYTYFDTIESSLFGMGESFYIGENTDNCIKLDLYYTDSFVTDVVTIDGIRLLSIPEIIAMKIDVVCRGGRKKDFWDIHELIQVYSLKQMLDFHKKRYPFGHNEDEIVKKFTDFDSADLDFNPVCLRGKHWEIIKLDLIDFVDGSLRSPF